MRVSLQISIGVAAAVVIYSLLCAIEGRNGGGPVADNLPWWFPRGSIFSAILFAILGVQNYQLLQYVGRGTYYEGPDDRVPWRSRLPSFLAERLPRRRASSTTPLPRPRQVKPGGGLNPPSAVSRGWNGAERRRAEHAVVEP